jgi:hypothetical protein
LQRSDGQTITREDRMSMQQRVGQRRMTGGGKASSQGAARSTAR